MGRARSRADGIESCCASPILRAVSNLSKAPAFASATRWNPALADVRSRSKTQTAIKSSCLSRGDRRLYLLLQFEESMGDFSAQFQLLSTRRINAGSIVFGFGSVLYSGKC